MDEDWAKIIAQGETMRVDFKGPMSWDGKDCASLAEDIVGMANVRDGGTILLGVSEEEDGSHVVRGLTQEQLATFDPTKICDFVSGYFQPAVSLRTERLTIDGKQLLAIKVSEFERTPVICVRDGPAKDPKRRHFYEGNLIVRTVAAKTVVIRTAEDMQSLIRLAVTKTSNALLADFRRILEGSSSPVRSPPPYEQDLASWTEAFAGAVDEWKSAHPGYGVFSFVLLPDYIGASDRDQSSLKKLVQGASVQLQGLDLPSCSPDQFTRLQNIPDGVQGRLDLGDYQEIWQFHESGAFMYGRLLLYRSDAQGAIFIPFEEIVLLAALAILFAQRLYQDLAPDSQLEYRFVLIGVKGQRLGSFDSFHDDRIMRMRLQAVVEPLEVEGSAAVIDLRSAWRPIVRQIAAKLITLFNWDKPEPAVDAQLDKIEGKRR